MSKKTHRSRRRPPIPASGHPQITPEQLYKQGEYAAVERSIRREPPNSRSDQGRRLLAKALVAQAKYGEARATLASISQPSSDDHLLGGWCWLQQERWDEAAALINESLKLTEKAISHLWLAQAIARGRTEYELKEDEVAMAAVIAHLEQAMSFSDCPEDVFLWRVGLIQGWEKDRIQERGVLLRRALEARPDSEAVRLRLSSHLLYEEDDPVDVTSILEPLLEQESPPVQALWNAFLAARATQDYDAAIRCIDRIPFDSADIGAEKIKGDILLKMGRYEEAIALYDAEYSSPRHVSTNLEPQIVALFSKARASLLHGEMPSARVAAQEALSLWLFVLGSNETQTVSLNDEQYLWIGSGDERQFFAYNDGDMIRYVCETLLDMFDAGVALDATFVGQLCYALYSISVYSESDESDDVQIKRERWLRRASSLVSHPSISGDLWWYYTYEKSELPLAVDHYLIYSCWASETRGDQFRRRKFESHVEALNKTQCKSVHKKAMVHLRGCSVLEVVTSVLRPFYREFWRDILVKNELWAEMADAVQLLLQRLPDDEYLMFDCALGLQNTGQAAEAEQYYRTLLEKQPENAAAMHNLSLLLRDGGQLVEALALSDHSLLVDPDESLYQNQNRKLRVAAEQQRRELERQESLLRTAPDRWPKLDRYKRQLLGVLSVINGFDSFDHLAELSGIEVKYLSGHWRKLIELGMIIEEGDKYRLNEYILPLIRQERSHTLMARVVRADPTVACKPVFNSQLEYTIYKILVEQFPNLLVFPNVRGRSKWC